MNNFISIKQLGPMHTFPGEPLLFSDLLFVKILVCESYVFNFVFVCSCDERIQKIQTIKVHEEIWICAAPHCFKSFLKKDEFDTHVRRSHGDLLKKKDSEAASARKPTSESTVQAPAKSALSPSSSFQQRD